MSLLFNMLSGLVITFLPRSKRLLISWLQSTCVVILEPPQKNSDTVSPSISHKVMGPNAMILFFWILSCKPTFHSRLSLSLFLFYFTLQYCIGFAIHWHESATGVHEFPILNHPPHLPPHIISLDHPRAPAPSILYPVSNIDWWFISYMIVYMFQCHSPKSSHPLPLPQSPKVRSIHLCLFCCLAYRVIITIFLNSIYMC